MTMQWHDGENGPPCVPERFRAEQRGGGRYSAAEM
jgi:hypothetical protein